MRGTYFIWNSDLKLAIVKSDKNKKWCAIPGMPPENLSFELCERLE